MRQLGVGIVGLRPGVSWAALAHVPALLALNKDFRIVGVATTSPQTARAAADAYAFPCGFASVDDLIADSLVDIVAVTIRVPHHFAIVKAALLAGKHVYCEWPLGKNLTEAEELATLARDRGVIAVAGMQAVASPAIGLVKRLITDGYIGDVLSTSLIGSGRAWGTSIASSNRYLADPANGATLLTIPFGHMLAAIGHVLGEMSVVSATMARRRTSITVSETAETIPLTSPDQLAVIGKLPGGAILSAHYRGGLNRGTNLLWEINGTEGDLQVTGGSGHVQMIPLAISGAKGDSLSLAPLRVPADDLSGRFADGVSANVGRIYAMMAQDIRAGTRTAPSFEDAVRLHHAIAAIEAAASQNGG